MLVPMVTRLDDLGLDGGQDHVEGLDGVLVWRMRRVEVENLFRCCGMMCRCRVSAGDIRQNTIYNSCNVPIIKFEEYSRRRACQVDGCSTRTIRDGASLRLQVVAMSDGNIVQ